MSNDVTFSVEKKECNSHQSEEESDSIKETSSCSTSKDQNAPILQQDQFQKLRQNRVLSELHGTMNTLSKISDVLDEIIHLTSFDTSKTTSKTSFNSDATSEINASNISKLARSESASLDKMISKIGNQHVNLIQEMRNWSEVQFKEEDDEK